MEQNKRKCTNDISDLSGIISMYKLQELQYLHRSIEAINYIDKNPLVIFNINNIFNEIEQYIIFIFKNFFSGIGFFYDKEYIDCYNINNYFSNNYGNCSRLNMIIFSTLSLKMLHLNFSNFITYLESKLIDCFIQMGIIKCDIKIHVEDGIMLNITIKQMADDFFNLILNRNSYERECGIPGELIPL